MSFSEKAQQVFYKELGLNNRQISQRMGNYNESLVSRYMNSKEPSKSFVKKIKEYFPELNYIDWFSDDEGLRVVNEKPDKYKIDAVKRINKIINELEAIKETLTQN